MNILQHYRELQKKQREERTNDMHVACAHCHRDLSRLSHVATPPPGVRGLPLIISPLICPYCGRSVITSSPVVKP